MQPTSPSMCNWCLQSSLINDIVLNLNDKEDRFFCSYACRRDYDDNTCCGFCNYFTLAAMEDLSLRLYLNAKIRKVFCSQQCLQACKQMMAATKFTTEVHPEIDDIILQLCKYKIIHLLMQFNVFKKKS